MEAMGEAPVKQKVTPAHTNGHFLSSGCPVLTRVKSVSAHAQLRSVSISNVLRLRIGALRVKYLNGDT